MAGQPSLPPGIQSKCDGQINILWPQIQADEANYLVVNGGYWQGLITHQNQIPQNGVDALPNVGPLTPTDQPDPWPPPLIANPLAIACVVDRYEGPLGQGYVMTAFLKVTQPGPQGVTLRWSRALASGPEPGWEHGWQLAPEPISPA